jgi:hypothetical protein
MFLEIKAWSGHEADSLDAICELIILTAWDPQCLENAVGHHDHLWG